MTTPPSLDFPTLAREVQEMPTVQAGLIVVLTRIRQALELVTQSDRPDATYLRWLARQIDDYAPELADACIESTPAQNPHEARAEYEQKLASLEGR